MSRTPTLLKYTLMTSASSKSRLSALSRQFNTMAQPRLGNPALFICDIQDKFRSAIYEFPKVVTTSEKMIKAAKILNIPIYLTTQNAARLGSTVSELTTLLPSPDTTPTDPSQMSSTTPATLLHDKTLFSMLTPTVQAAITSQSTQPLNPTHHPGPVSVIITGIETHICVTQTTLDLLAQGHKVYVLADGVSSCNREERWIALERLRAEGAVVTTSESILYELLRDAKREEFRAVSALVTKEFKEGTREALGCFGRL